MPSFFEIDFDPAEYDKDGYIQRKIANPSDFYRALSFIAINKVGSDVSNEQTLQIVKGILTTTGVPIIVGLRFSKDTSQQEREKVTAKALEKLQVLSQKLHDDLLSQVYTRNDFSDYQKKASEYVKQHYQEINDALQAEISQGNVALSAAMYLPTTEKVGRNFDAMISFGPSSITSIGTGFYAAKEVILCPADASKNVGLNVIVDQTKGIKFVTQQCEFFMIATNSSAENLLKALYRKKLQDLINITDKLFYSDKFSNVFKTARNEWHAREVMQSLQAEIEAIHSKKQSSIKDIVYLIEILMATEKLLTAPDDENIRRDFEQFARQAEGKPDYGKLIGGLMLALLGLVIAGLSIAAGVITGGTVLPLSALGIKASLPVIGTGISVLAMGASGTITTALGSGLMFWGRPKGLSAAMLDVDKIIGKSEKPSLA